MRIVHVTTVPQTLGYFLSGHIRYAQARGADVHVVSSPGERFTQFVNDHSVVGHEIPMSRRIAPLRDVRSLFVLCQRLRRIRPTVVHAHTPKAGLLGMLASLAARVPVRLYHLHGLPLMTARGVKRSILLRCDQLACQIATQVYSVSSSLSDVAIKERLCASRKIKVLANGSICGVDARGKLNPDKTDKDQRQQVRTQLGIDRKACVVGFVGRIVRDKGVEDLVSAWTFLRDRFPRLHLVVAGPLELEDPISTAARQILENDPRVHLLGHVTDIADHYTAMDILALPSHREGFGQVAIEAGAMNLPVVATRIPGCVDAVREGVTGLLVPPRDPAALAAAIGRYVEDPDLRLCHAAAGRQRVLTKFEPAILYRQLWLEYVRLAEEARADLPTLTDKRRAA